MNATYATAKMFHADPKWEQYHRSDLVCYYATKRSRPRLQAGRGICLFHRTGTRLITSCALFYDHDASFPKDELWPLCETHLGASTKTAWTYQYEQILPDTGSLHLIMAEQFFVLQFPVSWDDWTGRRTIPSEWPSFDDTAMARFKELAKLDRWPWE